MNGQSSHDSSNAHYFGVVGPYGTHVPRIAENVFIAPGAVVLGDVDLAVGVGIWYNTIVRGDINEITIGDRSNVQDGCVLHTGYGEAHALRIGRDVTIGHNACVHGCTVEDECLIGIGANVLNGARIRTHSYVAAGALVPPGMEVPSGVLVAGVPAKIIRDLKQSELDDLIPSAERYRKYAQEHYQALLNAR
ncbi:MAG TPA: gamma carbonic anhydrase family protein [Alkalispirochaeta sp.]|nr:gamma carbonic anhydrase family protein [Alkalispirochaeta sp.]